MYNEAKESTGAMVGNSLSAQVSKSSTERETESLYKEVSILQHLVMEIEKRLKPVLRDDYPKDEKDSSEVEESIPALANAIRQSRYVTLETIKTANNILSRLDI